MKPKQAEKELDVLIVAAYGHVQSMIPKADDPNPGGPMWHGWAIREAFIAGAKWQKRQAKRKPTRPIAK